MKNGLDIGLDELVDGTINGDVVKDFYCSVTIS